MKQTISFLFALCCSFPLVAQLTVTLDSTQDVSCNGNNDGAVFVTADLNSCSSTTVLINEFLVDGPGTGDGTGCGANGDPLSEEYIELIAPAGTDLSCYVLTDGDWILTLPAGSIVPSDGLFTIGHNNSPLHVGNGTTFDLDVEGCNCIADVGALSCQDLIFTNGGEYLTMYNASGTFIDGVIYGSPSSVNNTPTPGDIISTSGLTGCVGSVTIPALSSYATISVSGDVYQRDPDGGSTWAATNAMTPNACNVGGAGNLSFLWSNGDTTEDLSGLAGGTYTLTVTESNGTTATVTATINEPTAIVATSSLTDPNCPNSLDGAIDISVSGGANAYTFAWSNGEVTEDLTNVAAGSYSVTITDTTGCELVDSYQLNTPSGFAVALDSAVSPLCNGDANGTIDVSVTGGVAPITYLWSNTATTEDLSVLAAGTYALTVTDGNGCTDTLSAVLQDPTLLTASSSSQDESCALNDGQIDLSPQGGTAPYTFLWSDGSTTEDLSGLSAGSYTVTINDANACQTTATAQLAAARPPTLNPSLGYSNQQDTAMDLGLTIPATTGANEAGVSYSWTYSPAGGLNLSSDTLSDIELSGLSVGNYTITVSATANNCTLSETLTLEITELPEPAVPSAFTPNGDNINPSFRALYLDAAYVDEFKIYNRWGQLVYDNADNPVWDGTIEGTVQARDVYIYLISYQRPQDSEPVVLRGQVTLLR
ncbi:gliding motility-associated C-terminal domain-containing protein [Saprospira grandis]|uniref:Gliding motility-related protein n=1 Tax=Saprospira grandis (strain Lewin) TaxID=984262 RepID=H6L876_SAPGL|nr:gliding motility-associated C-terminal domain-containing protein [Saprospira grandis]AFC25404.1 gliding motility-related protein [Saprospira grandis str. Lewin]